MSDTDAPLFYWHESPGNRFRVDVADFDEAAECAYCVPVYSAETVDRLRARVAKLESARGEPVAWMNPYGGTLQVRITGLEYEKYTIPLYTAPPAQAVDVDAISDEAIVREALRDAGRYRWLRGTIFLAAVDGYENSYRREKLDAFIDNAIDTDMRKTP